MPSLTERKAGDRLALNAGFLHPIARTSLRRGTVSHPRDDTFQVEFAGVRERLASLNLETISELGVNAADDLAQLGFSLDQRKIPKIAAMQIEQIECNQHDLARLTLQLV